MTLNFINLYSYPESDVSLFVLGAMNVFFYVFNYEYKNVSGNQTFLFIQECFAIEDFFPSKVKNVSKMILKIFVPSVVDVLKFLEEAHCKNIIFGSKVMCCIYS